MVEMELKTKVKRNVRNSTNWKQILALRANLVQDSSISRPNQMVIAEITYVQRNRLFWGRFRTVIDGFVFRLPYGRRQLYNESIWRVSRRAGLRSYSI